MIFRNTARHAARFALFGLALFCTAAQAVPKAAENEHAPVTYGASDTPRPKPASKAPAASATAGKTKPQTATSKSSASAPKASAGTEKTKKQSPRSGS